MKNSAPSKLPQLLLLNFLAKLRTQRKYLMNTLIFVRRIYLSMLHKIYKFWGNDSEVKPPGNDGLTVKFYKHFSNELAPVPLDVYDSWRRLGTMGVTSRTGISMIFYKKVIQKYCKTMDPFQLRLQNLYY